MSNPPHFVHRKASEQFQRYAVLEQRNADACASLLSSTRDPIQRRRLEMKLQKARDQVKFYETKAREALDQDK